MFHKISGPSNGSQSSERIRTVLIRWFATPQDDFKKVLEELVVFADTHRIGITAARKNFVNHGQFLPKQLATVISKCCPIQSTLTTQSGKLSTTASIAGVNCASCSNCAIAVKTSCFVCDGTTPLKPTMLTRVPLYLHSPPPSQSVRHNVSGGERRRRSAEMQSEVPCIMHTPWRVG